MKSVKEWSDSFDTLVGSYRRFKDFDNQEILDSVEFNEYEKSYYLTSAQNEYVIALYNGNNPLGKSFEETEQLRRALAVLVVDKILEPIANSTGIPIGVKEGNQFFALPDDPAVWFITYEAAEVKEANCDSLKALEVVPVSQDQYHRLKKNPFRGANNRRALRLDLAEDVVEIVSKYPISQYHIRYVRKPKPIVLENLPKDLTIEGEQEQSDCELPEIVHNSILDLAVRMALSSKSIGAKDNNKQDNSTN